MGSYGIGPARIAAAAVEQFADEKGISWPRSLAPFDVHLVGLGKEGTEERELAERLYGELRELGLDVIYDDRDAGPGEKFADAELLGVPLRLTIGKRTIAGGRDRGAGPARAREPRHPAGGRGAGRGGPVGESPRGREAAKLTFRRLSGLDRSGAPPPETQEGAPLRPWTIPNAIGYVRLAAIPVFLVLALNSESGTDALPAVLFALIAWSDYFDGIAARVTGQYSRMGALLDPLVDRLLIIAGVIVCWKFELLPRWALALLAARELFMLVLARYAMAQARGIEGQLARPLGRVARVQRAVLRALQRRLARAGAALHRVGTGARGHCAVRS